MSKPKHRITSVLLTLCLILTLAAGVFLAAPVQVHAGIITANATLDKTTVAPGESVTYTYTYTAASDLSIMPLGVALYIEDSSGTSSFVSFATIRSDQDITDSFTHTFSAPSTPGTYTCYITYPSSPSPYRGSKITLVVQGASAPDAGTDEYYNRHYDFYYGVLGQLQQAADNATINVDATNQGIDMVMGFIFDELKNTNRTLIIKHQGSTYTIRGEPESADHLRMGGIALGNHHAFSILGDYRT